MSAATRVVGFIVALSVASTATVALAQVDAPAVVYTGPGEGDNVAAVRGILLSFAQRRGLGLHDLADAPLVPEVSVGATLDQAIADYSAFRYADAITKLDALESVVAKGGGAGLTRRQLADLYIYRAMSQTELGAANRARDDLVAAASIFPSYRLDEARFRPSLRAAFERARTAVAASATANVTVAAPVGCAVFVDSEPVAAGAAVTLRPGRHFIRGRCAGFHPFSTATTFDAGTHRFEPKLVSLPDSRTRALAVASTAKKVIWVSSSRANPSTINVSLVNTTTSKTERSWSLLIPDADSARALDDVLISLLDNEFRAAQPEPIVIEKERKQPWYERKWLWLGVGAVAATAIIVPFALRDTSPTGFDAGLGERPQ